MQKVIALPTKLMSLQSCHSVYTKTMVQGRDQFSPMIVATKGVYPHFGSKPYTSYSRLVETEMGGFPISADAPPPPPILNKILYGDRATFLAEMATEKEVYSLCVQRSKKNSCIDPC